MSLTCALRYDPQRAAGAGSGAGEAARAWDAGGSRSRRHGRHPRRAGCRQDVADPRRSSTPTVADTLVLSGACDPLPTPRPLGPLHDVAPDLDDASRAALGGAAQSHEIFAAVFEHVRRQPTLLVIDDLHWADQGTVDLLRYLLRRIGATRSMVVVGLRDQELAIDHPARALLGDVARSADATSMTLRPLSREAIVELADGRPVDAARIEQLTGGNPFFVTAMLDHDGDELPASVRDAILARTTDLDAEAWEVVHLLACAPEAIADHLLAGLGIGLPPLRALDRAGLIRRSARGVEFRHDLCRLAIATTIPPGGEVGLHQRMLAALETTPAPIRRSSPTTRSAPAIRSGCCATRPRRRGSRLASGARRQSAALLTVGARSRCAGAGRPAGRAAGVAGRGVLPDRPARPRHRRIRPGDGAAPPRRRRRRRLDQPPRAVRVPLVQRRPGHRRTPRRRRHRGVRRRRRGGRRRPARPRLRDAGVPGAAHQRPRRCHAADLDGIGDRRPQRRTTR